MRMGDCINDISDEDEMPRKMMKARLLKNIPLKQINSKMGTDQISERRNQSSGWVCCSEGGIGVDCGGTM
jgi:hypothetical protein